MFAELMSGGNVLVTGVESLPSLGLVVTAGMMMAASAGGFVFPLYSVAVVGGW